MVSHIKAQLAAQGIAPPKGQSRPATRPAAPRPVDSPGAGVASVTGHVKPAAEVTHYIGPYQLNVANGTHYPGRSRCVVVGPASDELTAALVAAITQLLEKP